jgi:hypothetical protein
MENTDGDPITIAPDNGYRVWIGLPKELPGALLAQFVRDGLDG